MRESVSIKAMTDGAAIDVADDQILAKQIIRGHMVIREHLGCSPHEALEVFAARYEVLRVERPDDFVCSRDEYGVGFYS
ncbi:hypothetical protein [Streptomyces sp. PKU-MA01144]|uniref:hypothetical protein n=1 Tax=Streptomyces sp. PKU-MA01144 TaxID=2729138 RepID=UPI002810F83C|nr:hypothetical protein [Streptomyces sp. PKU-MA01144]